VKERAGKQVDVGRSGAQPQAAQRPRTRAATAAVSLLAFLHVTAGCGGGGLESASPGTSAEVAPATAHAFAVVRTDRDAEQAQTALALVEQLVPGITRVIEGDGRVLPLLGPELSVVALAGGDTVVLVRRADAATLEELRGRRHGRVATRTVGGWTAIGASEAALDALEHGRRRGSLAANGCFLETFDALPDEALVKLWTSGGSTQRGRGLAAAVVADAVGVRITARRRAQEQAGGSGAAEQPPHVCDPAPRGSWSRPWDAAR
jgi:hypothetical protein